MPISVKTNQLTGPAVTGNSATTDPGFQPKALMIWNGLQTATGATADAQFNLGFASSTTTEVNYGYNSDDNVATSDVVRVFTSANDIVRNCTSGTVTTNIAASLNSFNATGFTPNWNTVTTANPLFNHLALGSGYYQCQIRYVHPCDDRVDPGSHRYWLSTGYCDFHRKPQTWCWGSQ
jgi:hypothetical protein